MPHNDNTLIGYHGTTEANAINILREQHFNPSSKENEWLGSGVYFFAYKYHADWWTHSKRYRTEPTCILRATLVYNDNQLLDLDNPKQLKDLNEYVKTAVECMNSSHLGVDADISKYNMFQMFNFSCNLYKELCPEIGIIIYTFPAARSSKPGISGYTGNQRQICVSQESIIQDIQKV